jgi:hypothetical protein
MKWFILFCFIYIIYQYGKGFIGAMLKDIKKLLYKEDGK